MEVWYIMPQSIRIKYAPESRLWLQIDFDNFMCKEVAVLFE